MLALPQPLTPATPHAVAMQQTRLEAVRIAEAMLPYFEAVYPEDSRPRLALDVAARFARGAAGEEERSTAERVARAAYDDANRDAETCDVSFRFFHGVISWLWQTVDAAEAVLEAVGAVVDLAAVQRLQDDAQRRSEVRF